MKENLEIKIEREKRRYLDFAEKNREKNKYIYGAGKQAKTVAEFLKSMNIRIDGFCVTNKDDNRKIEKGIPVYQVNELNLKPDEVAFFIGVRYQLNSEIIDILKKNKYFNYLESSDLVRYLGQYGFDFYTNPMMEITTQLGCAVNCKYCPQDVFINEYIKKENAARTLSFDSYKICIDKLPPNTLIEFAGFTEPFFNRECIKMIQYAVEKGFKVNIFTTLRGVTDEIVDQLLEIQFEEFVIHVPDEEGYSVIPIDDNYKRVLRKLVNAKKLNGDYYVDYASAQGTVPKEIKEIMGDDIRIYVVLNDRAGNLKDTNLYSKKNINGKIRCELAKDINHNVMLPDGRVIICSNDWGMKHVLGNLLEQSYEDIMNGEEAQRIRKAMNDETKDVILCRNCFQALEIE